MFKRIIVCLDIESNKLVKGKSFIINKIYGDPVKYSKNYSNIGLNEIVLLNINKEKISKFSLLLKKINKIVNIPISAGGNIKNLNDIKVLFESGADKICLNSTLVYNLGLVKKISKIYGKQSIIASIDVKKIKKKWYVFINGGKINTGIDVVNWARIIEKEGVGEFLITSIDRDGTSIGFDIKLLKNISRKINIPIIASGGGLKFGNILKTLNIKGVNSILLASSLHEKKINFYELKKKIKKEFSLK